MSFLAVDFDLDAGKSVFAAKRSRHFFAAICQHAFAIHIQPHRPLDAWLDFYEVAAFGVSVLTIPVPPVDFPSVRVFYCSMNCIRKSIRRIDPNLATVASSVLLCLVNH